MSHSNSSLNCFVDCMAKYKHRYILHTPPCKPPSPHLTFGTMAHDVLYKAGKRRDEYRDGLELDYESIIPSEVLYPELKTEFQISNWHNYFLPVIKQIAEYEQQALSSIKGEKQVYRELKLQMSPHDIYERYKVHVQQPFVGIIDLLVLGKDSAVILDYKFSSTRKGQDDFDQNSQLPLYAEFVNKEYGIPFRNIRVGYIDIPKKMFDAPVVLSNGTLSRSKSQNVSADLYKKAVEAIHGDDEKYNCNKDGYYYECWCALQLNKAAYMTVQYLDDDCRKAIMDDLLKTADLIDNVMVIDRYLRKYSSYSCAGCEYINSCKPWLGVGNE